MKKQFNNKVLLSLAIFLCSLVLVSCEKTYENTDAIIGKWQLISLTSANGTEIKASDDFIWQFNEDETYSIDNTHGKLEEDPYESNPFRDKGTYKGGYLVDAPMGLQIREEYRPVFHFSAVNIYEEEMTMGFTPVGATAKGTRGDVVLTFERIK
ncbi:MAG: hypothetical protein JKX68_10070 [Flavobacteriales bacterium]|nr:hypothetical protein [Flavobacteriales bacterium]